MSEDIYNRISILEQRLSALESDAGLALREASRGQIVSVCYETSAGQLITSGSITIVNYDTKVWDTHNTVTTGTAWKMTMPFDGFLLLHHNNRFADRNIWEAGEVIWSSVYLNNGFYRSVDLFEVGDMINSGGQPLLDLIGTNIMSVEQGDMVDIRINQSSGTATPLYDAVGSNYFQALLFKLRR